MTDVWDHERYLNSHTGAGVIFWRPHLDSICLKKSLDGATVWFARKTDFPTGFSQLWKWNRYCDMLLPHGLLNIVYDYHHQQPTIHQVASYSVNGSIDECQLAKCPNVTVKCGKDKYLYYLVSVGIVPEALKQDDDVTGFNVSQVKTQLSTNLWSTWIRNLDWQKAKVHGRVRVIVSQMIKYGYLK
jgi:hypothetical protein